MTILDASAVRGDLGGPSFSVGNRIFRAVWSLCWILLCRWTPPFFHRWRCFVLRLFGARIGKGVRVWSSARIWHPANLEMDDHSLLGRGVFCYNQGPIRIGRKAVISWDAVLCAGTHDYNDPYFQLYVKPIDIGAYAWIAAQAFVGPGTKVGEGAVLGARSVAPRLLEAWTIYAGNPSAKIRLRDKVKVLSIEIADGNA